MSEWSPTLPLHVELTDPVFSMSSLNMFVLAIMMLPGQDNELQLWLSHSFRMESICGWGLAS